MGLAATLAKGLLDAPQEEGGGRKEKCEVLQGVGFAEFAGCY